MHRGNKYLASLFVSAALMAPLGAFAIAAPQDDHERHEQEERERREQGASTIPITRTITTGINARTKSIGTGSKNGTKAMWIISG